MREVVLRSVGAAAITLVGLLGIAAFLHILVTLPFPDNKGAEWVGAIGTVGTLIGTIWLATDAQRKARQAQRDLATITAARIVREIPVAITAIEGAIEWWGDDGGDSPGYVYDSIAEAIENIATWDSADLSTLVILPNRAAAKLARAQADLDHLVGELRSAAAKYRMRQTLDCDEFEIGVRRTFKHVRSHLEDAHVECLAVLD